MRRRPPVKEVISRRMKQIGRDSPVAVARRAAERGAHLHQSTLKQILGGSTKSPTLSTCEAIALGLDLPPLQFIAELLGDRTDDPAVKASKFTNIADIYRDLTPSQKLKADAFIDGLLVQLHHIRNLSK